MEDNEENELIPEEARILGSVPLGEYSIYDLERLSKKIRMVFLDLDMDEELRLFIIEGLINDWCTRMSEDMNISDFNNTMYNGVYKGVRGAPGHFSWTQYDSTPSRTNNRLFLLGQKFKVMNAIAALFDKFQKSNIGIVTAGMIRAMSSKSTRKGIAKAIITTMMSKESIYEWPQRMFHEVADYVKTINNSPLLTRMDRPGMNEIESKYDVMEEILKLMEMYTMKFEYFYDRYELCIKDITEHGIGPFIKECCESSHELDIQKITQQKINASDELLKIFIRKAADAQRLYLAEAREKSGQPPLPHLGSLVEFGKRAYLRIKSMDGLFKRVQVSVYDLLLNNNEQANVYYSRLFHRVCDKNKEEEETEQADENCTGLMNRGENICWLNALCKSLGIDDQEKVTELKHILISDKKNIGVGKTPQDPIEMIGRFPKCTKESKLGIDPVTVRISKKNTGCTDSKHKTKPVDRILPFIECELQHTEDEITAQVSDEWTKEAQGVQCEFESEEGRCPLLGDCKVTEKIVAAGEKIVFVFRRSREQGDKAESYPWKIPRKLVINAIRKEEDKNYRLSGVVLYSYGHYFAYSRSNTGKRTWFKYDDTTCKKEEPKNSDLLTKSVIAVYSKV